MNNKKTIADYCLLAASALLFPFLLFTVLNGCLSPWPLYDRNRVLISTLTVVISVLFFALIRLLMRKKHHEQSGLLDFFWVLVFFLIQFYSALLLRHTPFTDTEQIVTAAENLAAVGSFEHVERSYQYLSWYPFNLGAVYLYAFLFKTLSLMGFQDHYMIIALFDSGLFALGFLAGLNAVRLISGQKSASVYTLLALLCFPFYYCTAELYTDVLALPFSTIILYFYLVAGKSGSKRNRIISILLFALFSAAGALLRVTTIIISIACLLDALFKCRFRLFLAALACLLVAMLTGNTLFERANARHLGAENLRVHRLSVWHYLAMGLPTHEDYGYGQYGDGGWLLLSTSFEDPQERDDALKEIIRDRVYYLRYPNRLLNMLSRKNVSTFGDGTFHLNQLIEADEHAVNNPLKEIIYAQGKFNKGYTALCTAIFYSQMILAGYSLLLYLRRKDTGGAPVFIALLGAFIYLTLWETNARYFFVFEFLLIIAASIRPVALLATDDRPQR